MSRSARSMVVGSFWRSSASWASNPSSACRAAVVGIVAHVAHPRQQPACTRWVTCSSSQAGDHHGARVAIAAATTSSFVLEPSGRLGRARGRPGRDGPLADHLGQQAAGHLGSAARPAAAAPARARPARRCRRRRSAPARYAAAGRLLDHPGAGGRGPPATADPAADPGRSTRDRTTSSTRKLSVTNSRRLTPSACLRRRDQGGVRDRQAERVPEQSRDGEPVGDRPDHRRLGRRVQVPPAAAPVEGQDVDHRGQAQQAQRDRAHPSQPAPPNLVGRGQLGAR